MHTLKWELHNYARYIILMVFNSGALDQGLNGRGVGITPELCNSRCPRNYIKIGALDVKETTLDSRDQSRIIIRLLGFDNLWSESLCQVFVGHFKRQIKQIIAIYGNHG